jgi:hypothetical protein
MWHNVTQRNTTHYNTTLHNIPYHTVKHLDGQTGSGKTHTMVGIQALMNEDLFDALNSDESYINTQVC